MDNIITIQLTQKELTTLQIAMERELNRLRAFDLGDEEMQAMIDHQIEADVLLTNLLYDAAR